MVSLTLGCPANWTAYAWFLVRCYSTPIKGDAAVAEAEERLMITQVPRTSAADERPVRRREPG